MDCAYTNHSPANLWRDVASLRKRWCEREEVKQDAICASWSKQDEAFLEREAKKRKMEAEGAAMGAWWCEGNEERQSEVPCLEHQLKSDSGELTDIDAQIREAKAAVRDLEQRRKETLQNKRLKDKELKLQIQKGSRDRKAHAALVAKMELEYCTEGPGKEQEKEEGGSLVCDAWREKQAKREL